MFRPGELLVVDDEGGTVPRPRQVDGATSRRFGGNAADAVEAYGQVEAQSSRGEQRVDDLRALFDHDSKSLLGRVSNNTCKLSVDNVGLAFEVPVDPDDPDHQRVAPKIRRGDLTGCSFAFTNPTATSIGKTYQIGVRVCSVVHLDTLSNPDCSVKFTQYC